MKQILKLTLIFITFFSVISSCYSQDIITLKNGDEIKSKVLEVTSDQIKYKKWDNLDGPSYSTAKSDVFMIKYKNGTKDVFNNAPSTSNTSNSGDKFIGNWFPKKGDRGGVKERLTISKAGQDYLIDYSRIEDAGGGMYIKDGSFKETGRIEGSNLVINSFQKLSLLNENTILLESEEFIKSPSQRTKTNIDRTNFTPDKLCKQWHMYKVIDLFDNGETRTREMNEQTKMGYTKYDCDTKTFTNHGMNKQPDGTYTESYVQNGKWELSNDHSTLTHTNLWNASEKIQKYEIINLTDNELVIIRTLVGRSDNLHSDQVFYTCDKKNFAIVTTPEEKTVPNTNSNSSNTNQKTNFDEKKKNTIYGTEDIKLIEGLIDLSRIEYADRRYFIGEFKHNAILGKSKIRFEESKEFNDLMIGYEQKGKKQETQRNYMFYKGILFYRLDIYVYVVRKLQNGIGIKMFVTSPLSSLDELYFEK